jgi:hypothetical protein
MSSSSSSSSKSSSGTSRAHRKPIQAPGATDRNATAAARRSTGPGASNARKETPSSAAPGVAPVVLSAEEKRQQRLARNRESARQSRRRKKQYLELLQEKVSQLTVEIDGLRRAHFARAAQRFREQRRGFLEFLEAEAARADTTPTDQAPRTQDTVHDRTDALRGKLEDALTGRYGTWTSERRAVSDYYFKQLNALLLPPYARFLLWILGQGAQNAGDSKNADARRPSSQESTRRNRTRVDGTDNVFSLFASELGLTKEQVRLTSP